jgi:hypothetical protein
MVQDRAGFLTFAISFIIAVGVILAVIFLDPGAIDAARGQVAVGISHAEYIARAKEWMRYSQESALRGEESYKLNCAFCHEGNGHSLLGQFKTGKLQHGGTELDVFKVISKGVHDQTGNMARMDHLMENERWDIVHYLRSLNPSLPSSSPSDINDYLKDEGF